VGFVGGETGYCSETGVTGGVGGTGEGSVGGEWAIDIKEEVCIKVEEDLDMKEEVGSTFEAVYIKEEIPETSTCPPTKTEYEVRLWSIW
jgi:hypothetical protein